ncbi:DUF1702 family protein [Streptomyces sp. NPDC058659]|uniref:DUF1702 family protein n=1 Tax=unclassified Streptomyces TaxID=2593676 RepID=UPI00366757E3
MPSTIGRLRRRLLTPSVSQTLLETRGFHHKTPEAKDLLETIGGRFLEGYGHAMAARTTAEAETHLEAIPERFRGFAYEGAGMAYAVLDAIPGGGTGGVERLLAGRGGAHVYMVYVGIGWSMGRLPRRWWADVERLDPLLRWLVLDGYGFHQAYFHTDRYVRRQHTDEHFAWPAHDFPHYTGRAIDQGIGRALWFVCGTDPGVVAATIETFPTARHSDLYSGVGLAATYAGGCGEEELTALWKQAGPHQGALAQGSAFAAETRLRAGLMVPHTGLATRVLCGLEPEEAAAVTQELRPSATSAAATTAPAGSSGARSGAAATAAAGSGGAGPAEAGSGAAATAAAGSGGARSAEAGSGAATAAAAGSRGAGSGGAGSGGAGSGGAGSVPAYEVWRQAIAERLIAGTERR